MERRIVNRQRVNPLSMRFALFVVALGVAGAALAPVQGAPSAPWVSLFNGRNLEGWTPKIVGHKLGEDPMRTFRVEGGNLVVRYDGYEKFDGRFGHLFYRTPASRYKLRLEYRFVGQQVPEGPGWAWKNSGVMIHGQPPETMGERQDFPVSAEVQLPGGDKEGDRPTANLCTPGTNVMYNGQLWRQHCTNSNSPTFRGEEWVRLELDVNGPEDVVHYINGQEVFRYREVQLDPNDADAKAWAALGAESLIRGGSISLQSESHPVEFRRIALQLKR